MKNAAQLAHLVLSKFAAFEEGRAAWKNMVNRIARVRGFKPPTEQEFEAMFPQGWGASATENVESRINNSNWMKSHINTDAKIPHGNPFTDPHRESYYRERSGPQPGWSPKDVNWNDFDDDFTSNTRPPRDPFRSGVDWDAARPSMHEQVKQVMHEFRKDMLRSSINRAKVYQGGAGLATGAVGVGAAASSILGARNAKTPEERSAILGLGGGLAGLSGAEAWNHKVKYQRLGKVLETLNLDKVPLSEISDNLSHMPKSRSYIGGLAGLGLGLGGAAVWNHFSDKPPLAKAASITPEEIALGLTGKAARPDISNDEIKELEDRLREEALEKHKWDPLKGGLLGGLHGGASGAYFKHLFRPGSGSSLLPMVLSGAGIGAGLGGLAGLGSRSLGGTWGGSRGQILGRAARTGKLRKGQHRAEELEPYAVGNMPDAKLMSPEKEQEIRHNVLKKLVRYDALRGIPLALTVAPFLPPVEGLKILGLGALGGAAIGAQQAPKISDKVIDLRNRGFGRLSKKMEDEL